MWQNNLLKFYIEHDVPKAIEYARQLIEEVAHQLPANDRAELKFSLATSMILEGDPEYLPEAKSIFAVCADETADPLFKGYVYNNQGMANWYHFVHMSQQGRDKMTDPEQLKPMIEALEGTMEHLKKSVRSFEQFDALFEVLQSEDAAQVSSEQVDASLVKHKLFVDEFFTHTPGQIIP